MAPSRSKRAGGGGGGGSNKEMEVRRGPWTLEEDTLLIHYITCHGEGRWNLLARCSGLKRTGKSCRLRWLNYLKPDIKRGNLSPEEQLLILDLHSKWGNRWSRIAQYLPGRTDNEIKNYWRTRVQKQARQLKIDANSAMFRDALRCYWMPRLLEKYAAAAAAAVPASSPHQYSTQTQLANLDFPSGIRSTAEPAMILDDHRPQTPQELHYLRPGLQCQFGDEMTAGSAGVAGKSSTAAAALVSHQFSDLPQFSSDEVHGGGRVEVDPFHAGNCADPLAAGPDYGLANPNCGDVGGGSTLWSTDELYGMLKSYMEIGEEDCMFPLDDDDDYEWM